MNESAKRIRLLAAAVAVVVFATAAAASRLRAQTTPPAVTAQDYARGESLLPEHTTPLVLGGAVRPNWLDGDRFWYLNATREGTEVVLADPVAGTRARAFDHERLAAALSAIADTTYAPLGLPLDGARMSADASRLTLRAGDRTALCDLARHRCTADAAAESGNPNAIVSPDGAKAAFIRDHNLWLRDLASGEESALTDDGVADLGYATDNAGWVRRESPVLLWSPGSDMIATFRHDGRGVGEMHLTTTAVGRPRLSSWKYPLPGDSVVFRIERVVVHLDGPRAVSLDMPPDPHRSSVTDHVAGRGGAFLDVQWSRDGSRLAFVSSSRDHKRARLRIADPETGAVRDVLEETEETFFESGSRTPNWRVLDRSAEALWYSKRDGWGHLYRHDLETGALLGRVTRGPWNVKRLLRVDEDEGTLLFVGAGREPGDPYFEHLYSVRIDGSGLKRLTPDSANHEVALSPSGTRFVDVASTPVVPPVSVVRSIEGELALELETADVSALLQAGWTPPEPFVVKARDGETDLHGLMYKPSNFDPSRAYPVVNYLYPGPQSGSVGSRSFRPSRGDKQALAELGFIVVEVDAMGTPGRSKAFHDAYYGNMGDNGLPDQVGMVRQLGARFPWMDLERVGIWGHSGGGFAAAAGILRYPAFYKAAVSQAGNHDNRSYEDDWGEKWQGLLETRADGTTNYDNQANQLLAENLEGKLLLAHGTMDTNVPHYNTLLLADALIAANKDFDLIMLPNRGHGFSSEPYMTRRRWDHFVRHLLGVEPPEYLIGERRFRPVSE